MDFLIQGKGKSEVKLLLYPFNDTALLQAGTHRANTSAVQQETSRREGHHQQYCYRKGERLHTLGHPACQPSSMNCSELPCVCVRSDHLLLAQKNVFILCCQSGATHCLAQSVNG